MSKEAHISARVSNEMYSCLVEDGGAIGEPYAVVLRNILHEKYAARIAEKIAARKKSVPSIDTSRPKTRQQ